MVSIRWLTALTVLAFTSGCATLTRFDAAGDIHDFLVAIRNDDRATFNAHIDRPALKAQFEARLIAEGKRRGGTALGALAALIAGPAASMTGDALVQPKTFKVAAEYFGYSMSRPIPDRLSIAGSLRALPHDEVCVARKKTGPCLFTFTREGGIWKLTGFDGAVSKAR